VRRRKREGKEIQDIVLVTVATLTIEDPQTHLDDGLEPMVEVALLCIAAAAVLHWERETGKLLIEGARIEVDVRLMLSRDEEEEEAVGDCLRHQTGREIRLVDGCNEWIHVRSHDTTRETGLLESIYQIADEVRLQVR
jgi:hypothetical protein